MPMPTTRTSKMADTMKVINKATRTDIMMTSIMTRELVVISHPIKDKDGGEVKIQRKIPKLSATSL